MDTFAALIDEKYVTDVLGYGCDEGMFVQGSLLEMELGCEDFHSRILE
jgi:hypothetical protein